MSTGTPCRRRLVGSWLGARRYAPIHELQQALHRARAQGSVPDTVLLLEHEAVITTGKGTKPGHLLAPRESLHARGVDLVDVGRGGDVTLHAPGQLVCYPIIDLSPDRRDVRRYVQNLAEVMRRLIAPFGIASGTVDGMVGVWVDAARPGAWQGLEGAQKAAKIGAIGVRISRWVTMHGFALNVSNDLGLFDMIVPCGISEYPVTSVERLTDERPALRRMASAALEALGETMDAEVDVLEDCSDVPLSDLFPAEASRAAARPLAGE